MKNYLLYGKLVHIESLNCSINGNPKKRVIIEDADGNTYSANTQTDAACAYSIGYYSKGHDFVFIYHYTKNGNMVISYIYSQSDYLYRAYTTAGYRERYAMENGKRTYKNITGDNCIVFTYNKKDKYQDANGATYNIDRAAWVN